MVEVRSTDVSEVYQYQYPQFAVRGYTVQLQPRVSTRTSQPHQSTVQYSTVQYSTVQYSKVQYSTVQLVKQLSQLKLFKLVQAEKDIFKKRSFYTKLISNTNTILECIKNIFCHPIQFFCHLTLDI